MARSPRSPDDPREIIPGPYGPTIILFFVAVAFLFYFDRHQGRPNTSEFLMAGIAAFLAYAICWGQTFAHRRRLAAAIARRAATGDAPADPAPPVPRPAGRAVARLTGSRD